MHQISNFNNSNKNELTHQAFESIQLRIKSTPQACQSQFYGFIQIEPKILDLKFYRNYVLDRVSNNISNIIFYDLKYIKIHVKYTYNTSSTSSWLLKVKK